MRTVDSDEEDDDIFDDVRSMIAQGQMQGFTYFNGSEYEDNRTMRQKRSNNARDFFSVTSVGLHAFMKRKTTRNLWQSEIILFHLDRKGRNPSLPYYSVVDYFRYERCKPLKHCSIEVQRCLIYTKYWRFTRGNPLASQISTFVRWPHHSPAFYTCLITEDRRCRPQYSRSV